MSSSRLFPSLVFFILISAHIQAQVVNIEKKRKAAKDGLQGDIDLSIAFNRNVSDIFQMKNSLKLQYYKGQNLFLFFDDLSLIKAGGQNFVNDGFQHLRYNYNFKKAERITLEAFAQYQYNSIKKLRNRFLFGAGPRITIVDSGIVRLHIGPLIMYEMERITGESLFRQKTRLSTYLAFNLDFKEQTSFSHTSYYQPHIADFPDYRFSSETYLKILLIKRLSMKIIFDSIFDSRPPLNIPNHTYSLSTGLNYAF